MDPKELLKMLNIEAKPSTKNQTAIEASVEQEFDITYSDSALELDEWDLQRGEELSRRPGRTDYHVLELADFHAAAYQTEPTLVEHCTFARRRQFLETLMQSPEYQSLHESTKLNSVASELACDQFAAQYDKLCGEDAKLWASKPKTDKAHKRAANKLLLKCVNTALEEAQEKVDELESSMAALGHGPGELGAPLDPKQISKLFNRVRNNNLLRRICERAGRYRRVAQGKQRQKTKHGYEDMVGITLDDRLEFLLNEELMLLCDEDFELDAMRRLVERETLATEYRGTEKVGKGPIIVCVDESGSMDGEPVCEAKAFALSMYWIARHQKRWCCLVGYSGGTEGTRLILPPGKHKDTELCDWLCHFFGNGTDMDVPLAELPAKYWNELLASGMKRGKTDLILISDAICHVPYDMEQQFLKWKTAEKVRCISLIIGQHHAGGLAKVSDEVHLMNKIGLDQTGVMNCLSI